jgi:hypothetical protein
VQRTKNIGAFAGRSVWPRTAMNIGILIAAIALVCVLNSPAEAWVRLTAASPLVEADWQSLAASSIRKELFW